MEGPVPAHRDLLLHDTKAIEPAEQEASTVHTKVEVYVVTCKPAQSQRRSGSDWAQLPCPQTPIIRATSVKAHVTVNNEIYL